MSNDIINKIVLIQRCYRHHLMGRKHRSDLKMNYLALLWDFKPFRIALVWDESAYYKYRSKSYKEFLLLIVKCINTLFHPDDDDDEPYNLTVDQTSIINSVMMKKHVGRDDMNKVLKSLTRHQIALIR